MTMSYNLYGPREELDYRARTLPDGTNQIWYWYNVNGQRIAKKYRYYYWYDCPDTLPQPRGMGRGLGGDRCKGWANQYTGYYYFGDNMLSEYSGPSEGDLRGNYVYVNGERVARFKSELSDVRYYLCDHLGSVVATVKSDGALRNWYQYHPFGDIYQRTAYDYSSFEYTSKEREAELSVVWNYYGARYYDPKLRIFTQVDPSHSRYPAWGPYVYTLDNPMTYIDPDGKQTVREIGYWLCHFPHFERMAKMVENVRRASQMAREGFPREEEAVGKRDAYRHALWSAMNARDFGVEVATQIGNVHEMGSGDPASTEMDLHNNEVGFEIGEEHPNTTDEELAELVWQAYKEGLLQLEVEEGTTKEAAKQIAEYEYQYEVLQTALKLMWRGP